MSQLCSGRLGGSDHLSGLEEIINLNANTIPSDPSRPVEGYWDAWWSDVEGPSGTLQGGIALFENQVYSEHRVHSINDSHSVQACDPPPMQMPARSVQDRLKLDAEYMNLLLQFSHVKLAKFLQTGWKDMGGDVAVESVLVRGGTLPPVPGTAPPNPRS